MEKFDYNLIRVFCALYDTKSLTLTAERLHISQPAVSQLLKKLRLEYDDLLFVRSHGKMEPTLLTHKIIPNLKKSIELIELSLNNQGFNNSLPQKENYIITMSDLAQSYFIPPLCMLLDNSKLKININVVQLQQDEIEINMRNGKLDFAIGNFPKLKENNQNLIFEKLFKDHFVLMLRDGHPLISKNGDQVDLKKLQLVQINTNITGHSEIINRILKDFNFDTKITIPYYSATPDIVSKTDYGVIIPSSIAKRYNFYSQFKIFEIDNQYNSIDVSLFYHKLFKNDSAISWMRQLILDNFSIE
ncbi:LysR family transcriptional regulator [Acinetobacter calcoaceticus]|uniref:LysR family transcriptional regulator n=1 Tax=Acinetobacter calcoaceticus TaxID=471 RepID=A0A4R1XQP9_ACICA|nr:LysR family transcriptional regulator [Acinetobacter calcoaceticus]